jgi:putative ABC transport system ATP-binding protein
VQNLLRVGDRVTAIVVLGDDYRNVEPVYEKVHALVDDGVTVSRWTELDTYLGTMLRVMDGFVIVWVIIIFLALSFGLVNTLVMAVFERVREIGLMLALGMKPSSILGQIVIESMMLLVIGLAIGNLLAWASIKPLESGIDVSVVAEGMAMMGAASVLYPQLRFEDVILANTVVLFREPVAGVASVPLPAHRSNYKGELMTAVRCVDLCKTYRQGDQDIKALDHLSMEVEDGGFVCLSSPSGGGKTTLLNAIGGLDKPDSGEVYIAGDRIDNLSKGALAELRLHRIGFVFQAFNLIPVLSARENVEFVMQVQGVPASERRGKSLEILEEVGLEGLEDRLPSEMSGGQQQRVAVARAIVSNPALVLADEPTANLDSKTADGLIDLFKHLNEHHGTTFIIATHDQRVMAYAKRLVRMLDGRIVEEIDQNAA